MEKRQLKLKTKIKNKIVTISIAMLLLSMVMVGAVGAATNQHHHQYQSTPTPTSTPIPTPTPTPTSTLVNPVGGGSGYTNIINSAKANYIVSTKSQLLSALSSAKSGNIIYISDTANIDLTGESDLNIPPGVTLASGRGNGGSQGALLYSNNIQFTNGVQVDHILFSGVGANARITGLRLKGPDNGIDTSVTTHSISYGMTSFDNIEVDNIEISNWTIAVDLYYSGKTQYIHNNYIHDNRRSGLGYGVAVEVGSSPTIEANIFDWNRHSISGDASTNSGYIARYNLVLGHGNDRSFDMHGDDAGMAGKNISIYGNTFYRIYDPDPNSYCTGPSGNGYCGAIEIRGVPAEGAYVYNNYFHSISTDVDYNGNPTIYQSQYTEPLNPMEKTYVNNNSYNGKVI